MISSRAIAIFAFILPSAAIGATLSELSKYDLNRNGRIDTGDEIRVYAMHQAKPLLAKYDTGPIDGKLDGEELAKLKRDLEVVPEKDPNFLVTVGYLQSEAEREHGIPLTQLAEQKPAPSGGPCKSGQGLYIRRDRADISVYNNSIDKSAAKGASLSYTNDRLSGSEVAEIHGTASYVAARDPCVERPAGTSISEPFVSGYALAGWVSADGTFSSNRSTEKSALKFGVDAQAEVFSGAIFDAQYFTLSPYYQTDFRGDASAYGMTASWEPFLLSWKLGGSYQQVSPWFDFFWQLKAESDVLHVAEVGLTSLRPGADYAWQGGTVRLNAFPFPEFLSYRLSFITVYNYYWDAKSGDEIWFVNPALAYNIVEDGSTSVSLEYKKGTEKSTLKETDRYVLSLNYKF